MTLTFRCWNNQARISEVADFGNRPRFLWRYVGGAPSSFSSQGSLSKLSCESSNDAAGCVGIGEEYTDLGSSLLIRLSSSDWLSSMRRLLQIDQRTVLLSSIKVRTYSGVLLFSKVMYLWQKSSHSSWTLSISSKWNRKIWIAFIIWNVLLFDSLKSESKSTYEMIDFVIDCATLWRRCFVQLYERQVWLQWSLQHVLLTWSVKSRISSFNEPSEVREWIANSHFWCTRVSSGKSGWLNGEIALEEKLLQRSPLTWRLVLCWCSLRGYRVGKWLWGVSIDRDPRVSIWLSLGQLRGKDIRRRLVERMGWTNMQQCFSLPAVYHLSFRIVEMHFDDEENRYICHLLRRINYSNEGEIDYSWPRRDNWKVRTDVLPLRWLKTRGVGNIGSLFNFQRGERLTHDLQCVFPIDSV